MIYEQYINQGFKRTDITDSVEFRQTGYYGFFLSKKVNNKMSIEVSSSELEKPRLYIKKQNDEKYHILPITIEIVKDILSKNK
jgi:hypothetical protein